MVKYLIRMLTYKLTFLTGNMETGPTLCSWVDVAILANTFT
jgi:hypothetical protein